MSLIIGEGFQNWINDHQATPLSDEQYFNPEMSCILVQYADSTGNTQKAFLIYNKDTNEIIPFVAASL